MYLNKPKRCIACKQIKPAEYFYLNTTFADGREGKCKQCRRAERRQRHLEKTT